MKAKYYCKKVITGYGEERYIPFIGYNTPAFDANPLDLYPLKLVGTWVVQNDGIEVCFEFEFAKEICELHSKQKEVETIKIDL